MIICRTPQAPLNSEFADVPGFSKVTFTFAEVSILNDGVVNIEFPDLNDLEKLTTFTCLLQDALFDQGKTKKVHKWFFNIGAGEGVVEIQENYHQVVKEVTRLSKAGYFFKRSIVEVNKQAVDITQDAPAQCRTGVEQMSTLLASVGSTLNAFTHYAYLLSLESTVVADLQTATTIDEDGNGIQVLFDVISSGVSDHGMAGIDTFLEKHECVDRWKQLCLHRSGFATEPPLEDSDDNDA
ncbi:hypothetical protein C8R44DRAFT_749422 [Mycena epipterygia]|nr:hypothetical protein C8R44DRAFT_749422 [Mycena epipterygia]